MSRLLAELLHAPELNFRAHLKQLERASGLPSNDVKMTAHMIRANHEKLRALGLDIHDTTSKELYAVLNQRYLQDNKQLLEALARNGHLEGEAHEVMSVVYHALGHLPLPEQSLAVKPSVLKRLLKKQVPKLTMKRLGYRSIDSMLKHEPMAALQVAAEILEPHSWQQSYSKALAKLNGTDFENRRLQIVYLNHARWQKLAEAPGFKRQHHIVSVPLSATLLLMPFGEIAPKAAVLSSLVTAITAINHLASSSSYLKLHRMRPDFGEVVSQLREENGTPLLELFGEPISWQLVQRYYHRFKDVYRAEVFEPYLQPEDFVWLGVDVAVRHLASSLAFWQGSSELGHIHDGNVVSYNLHDVAVNASNNLPFASRVSKHFREALWHELLLSYLQPAQIEQALLQHMQPAMAYAKVKHNEDF